MYWKRTIWTESKLISWLVQFTKTNTLLIVDALVGQNTSNHKAITKINKLCLFA